MLKTIVCLSLISVCVATACNQAYSKVGCMKNNRDVFTEQIANNRDSTSSVFTGTLLDWNNYSETLSQLACECADLAKNGGYVAFALGFYGECYAAKDQTAYDNYVLSSEASSDCIMYSHDYVACDSSGTDNCVGTEDSEFVYTFPSAAPEKINGGFGNWSDFSSCSVSCGEGVQEKERLCNNPQPKNGGDDCVGEPSESRACKVRECPINGGFSEWSDYDTCSASCGGGNQERSRSCTNPAPQHGGDDCVGETVESRKCGEDACPINGGFSSWSSYNQCSKSCGGGNQRRTRTCTNPAPQHGGNGCVGAKSQNRNCGTSPCPIDATWSSWGSYGSCSKTCGSGSKTKRRSCTGALHGGRTTCSGSSSSTTNCYIKRCPTWTDYHSNSVCEGGSMTLSCSHPDQTIRLSTYFYGRTNKSTCPGSSYFWSTNCKGGHGRIRSACEGKNKCTVEANNRWMNDDPCRGTPKYFYVIFRCYG